MREKHVREPMFCTVYWGSPRPFKAIVCHNERTKINVYLKRFLRLVNVRGNCYRRYCPNLAWDNHTVSINGLVSEPLTITMDELSKMETFTIPVTLVCAGNRRKEQNMVKKTNGCALEVNNEANSLLLQKYLRS